MTRCINRAKIILPKLLNRIKVFAINQTFSKISLTHPQQHDIGISLVDKISAYYLFNLKKNNALKSVTYEFLFVRHHIYLCCVNQFSLDLQTRFAIYDGTKHLQRIHYKIYTNITHTQHTHVYAIYKLVVSQNLRFIYIWGWPHLGMC